MGLYNSCMKHDVDLLSCIRWGNSRYSVWKVKQTVPWVHSDRPVWKRIEIVRPSPNSFDTDNVPFVQEFQFLKCVFSQRLYAYWKRLHLVHKKGHHTDLPLPVKDFPRRGGTRWGQSSLLDGIVTRNDQWLCLISFLLEACNPPKKNLMKSSYTNFIIF